MNLCLYTQYSQKLWTQIQGSYGRVKSEKTAFLRAVGKGQEMLLKLEENMENVRNFYHPCKKLCCD